MIHQPRLSRRTFLRAASVTAAAAGGALYAGPFSQPRFAGAAEEKPKRARVSITLDLEMSAEYPRRGMTEWNFQKGNLDEDTKRYSLEAARRVRERGGVIHFFCVGRVLEQPDIAWLKELHEQGHPIGNHTYDHVALKAETAEATQFRFQRSPWLVEGRTAAEVIRENILLCTRALKARAGFAPRGFRTPGGFNNGLEDRVDLQELLLDCGFSWVSSKYPAHLNTPPGEAPDEKVFQSIVAAQEHAQPFKYPSGLIELPMNPVSDVSAFRAARWKMEPFLEATRRGLSWVIERGAVYNFLSHPSCLVVEDPEFRIVDTICDMVKAAGERAKIVDLDSVAAEF